MVQVRPPHEHFSQHDSDYNDSNYIAKKHQFSMLANYLVPVVLLLVVGRFLYAYYVVSLLVFDTLYWSFKLTLAIYCSYIARP